MSYSQFTLEGVLRRFGLPLNDRAKLFVDLPPRRPSDLLSAWLAETVHWARSHLTEKARSEGMIAPVLLELRRMTEHRISVHSGNRFDVDPACGLDGACDFLLSQSPQELLFRPPFFAVVVTTLDVSDALGQCAAEMVAARLFNERAGVSLPAVYGVVSTGSVWQFLKLQGGTLFIEPTEYHIREPGLILGILRHIVDTTVPPPQPAPSVAPSVTPAA